MIPRQLITISKRHAEVMSGQLATEKHGKEKQAFIDLKLKFLIDKKEIDTWLGVEKSEQVPSGSLPHAVIFDDQDSLRLPQLELTGKIRDNLKGDLIISGIYPELKLADAHIVGSVSGLSFQAGAHGVVVLQLRFDAGAFLDQIIGYIEKGECELKFVEYKDNKTANEPDAQEKMPV